MNDPYIAAIESVFDEFNIDAIVANAVKGPSVTRYEVALGDGVRVEKIARLQKNIAYATAAESVRILAPIPGKMAVGIELPNAERDVVTLERMPAAGHPLDVYIGESVEGEAVTANLAKMPHLLVAGTTGSGKSSFINSMLVNLLNADPEKVNLLLIDPKMVELTPYGGVPHLLQPVITEVKDAVKALAWLTGEMDRRYQAMRDQGARNIEGMGFPYIVVVVDELADLMMEDREHIEAPIVRLAQKARAAGIHLVLATQRPSVDVVTGLIKANVPSRLAFSTSSHVDSKVVLDETGAEQLLGMGDGLFKPVGARVAVRIQGAYVTDDEISAAVNRAVAHGRVEAMVERLGPPLDDVPTVLDYINVLIADADKASKRAGGYMTKLCKKDRWFSNKTDKVELLAQAPVVLGRATDDLVRLTESLKVLRDEALMQQQ